MLQEEMPDCFIDVFNSAGDFDDVTFSASSCCVQYI